MIDAECVGGPLDGRFVREQEFGGFLLSFPWPTGWYYARYDREHARVWYQWDGEPGHYLPQDEQWLREHPIPLLVEDV